MRIPVFVSCPSDLTARQKELRAQILVRLEHLGLEWRTLGGSDYPTQEPLVEVRALLAHCSGAVILGFSQGVATAGSHKPDTEKSRDIDADSPYCWPTPWNQLEAAMAFMLGLPLLVMCEPEVSGGVFDPGTAGVFVHQLARPSDVDDDEGPVAAAVLKWQASVRERYYAV